MNGPDAFRALKRVTETRPWRSVINIHPVDMLDLRKLAPSDLEHFGFDQALADAVSAELLDGKLIQLGDSLGLTLHVNPSAERMRPSD